ncbi:MAG: hypothetical protein BMS9Abin05_1209 [Rhodothermia bacterium]|nr:MAG: hypothetical protein BMS9Abin05_1209 [Rhodothermia bacterium]
MTIRCHTPIIRLLAKKKHEFKKPVIMVRTSAYPTVEWLTRTGRTPVSRESESGKGLSRSPRSSDISNSVAGQLKAWCKGNTIVAQSIWIRTPNGEDPVDIVIERKNRRIGIRFSSRYEIDSDNSDALVLVYGRFDALYRITHATHESTKVKAGDISYSIVSMYPGWFTSEGRVAAGRSAGTEALLHSDGLAWKGVLQLPGALINRIRLSRASDWVAAFERALSPPRLVTYADVRTACSRR